MQNLSNAKFEALKNLSRNCNLAVQGEDNSDSAVIVEKDIYLRLMETILSDLNKFEKVSTKNRILNFSINCEKKF